MKFRSAVKTSILTGLLLSCFCFGLKAQIRRQGAVMDKETRLRIALAEIQNKQTGVTVGSNDLGIFNILAKPGDTLLIIKRGYNDQQLVVPSQGDMLVYLNRGIMLQEVEIKGQSKRQLLDETKRDFKKKGSYYAGKPPFLSFLFTPLTAIYELVGRTPRNARRFNRYYITEIEQLEIDQVFNKGLITGQTGLSGAQLDAFMIRYRPDYEQAKHWNTYDGIKWIKDSYKKFTDTVAVGSEPEKLLNH